MNKYKSSKLVGDFTESLIESAACLVQFSCSAVEIGL